MTRPKCDKGTACGGTCIAKGLNCIDNLDPGLASTAKAFVEQLSGEAKREKKAVELGQPL